MELTCATRASCWMSLPCTDQSDGHVRHIALPVWWRPRLQVGALVLSSVFVPAVSCFDVTRLVSDVVGMFRPVIGHARFGACGDLPRLVPSVQDCGVRGRWPRRSRPWEPHSLGLGVHDVPKLQQGSGTGSSTSNTINFCTETAVVRFQLV